MKQLRDVTSKEDFIEKYSTLDFGDLDFKDRFIEIYGFTEDFIDWCTNTNLLNDGSLYIVMYGHLTFRQNVEELLKNFDITKNFDKTPSEFNIRKKCGYDTTSRLDEYFKDTRIEDYGVFMKALFKELKLSYDELRSFPKDKPYEVYSHWTLLYKESDYNTIKKDMTKLNKIEFLNKPIFIVSGNGYGTGISVNLNLSSQYDS
jgi:hypothetical protein